MICLSHCDAGRQDANSKSIEKHKGISRRKDKRKQIQAKVVDETNIKQVIPRGKVNLRPERCRIKKPAQSVAKMKEMDN
jgi:hypothetical protein